MYAIMALGVYITYESWIFRICPWTAPSLWELLLPHRHSNGLPFVEPSQSPPFPSPFRGRAGGLLYRTHPVKLKVRDLLSGIIVMTALYSINLRIAGKANLPIFSQGDHFQQPIAEKPVPEALSPTRWR